MLGLPVKAINGYTMTRTLQSQLDKLLKEMTTISLVNCRQYMKGAMNLDMSGAALVEYRVRPQCQEFEYLNNIW